MPIQDMGSCSTNGFPCTLYAKLQCINSVLLVHTDYYFRESTLNARDLCFVTLTSRHRPQPSRKILRWVERILRNHMCVQTVLIHIPIPPSLAEIVYSHMWWIKQAILPDDDYLGDSCTWKALKRLHLQTANRPKNKFLRTATECVTVFNEDAVIEGLASAVATSIDTNYTNAMALEGNTHVESLMVACVRDVNADFGAVKRLLESMTSLKEVTWAFKMDDLSTYDAVMQIIDASCCTVSSVKLLTLPAPTPQCPLGDTSSIAFVRKALAYQSLAKIGMGATDADLAEFGILPPQEDDSDAVGVLGPYVNSYLSELSLTDLNGTHCRFRATYAHPQDSRCFLYRMGSDDMALVDRLDFTRSPYLTVLRIKCAQSSRDYPDHYSNFFQRASTYLRSPSCTIRELTLTFCKTCNRQAYGDMMDAMCINTSVTWFDSNLPIRTQEECQKFARMVSLNNTLLKFSPFYTAPAEGESIDLKCILNALRDQNYTLVAMSIPYPITDRHYVHIDHYLHRNHCIINRAVDLINEAEGGELEDEDLKIIALVPKEKLKARVGAEAATFYYNEFNRKYFRLTNVSPHERFQNSDDWRHVFSYLGIQDVSGIQFVI